MIFVQDYFMNIKVITDVHVNSLKNLKKLKNLNEVGTMKINRTKVAKRLALISI